jgi:hypothetical protein
VPFYKFVFHIFLLLFILCVVFDIIYLTDLIFLILLLFPKLRDPDVDGRIILRWIFRKWEGVMGTGWSWLRIGTGGGHL